MFAARIRELRQAKGMNQRELAELTHTPQSLVSNLERGTMKPWPAVVKRLCEALDCQSSELFPEGESCATRQ